jgi:hypothetical protein
MEKSELIATILVRFMINSHIEASWFLDVLASNPGSQLLRPVVMLALFQTSLILK